MLTGHNVLGSTESKSFELGDVGTGDGDGSASPVKRSRTVVSVSISSFRIVDPKWRTKYAQFLVIYCEGDPNNAVAAWRRFSDFDRLAQRIAHNGQECCFLRPAGFQPFGETREGEKCKEGVESLPRAVKSWRRLKKRMRWHRCFDPGYLGLKAFLLESYLHDILLESSSPKTLSDFVGANGGNLR